MKKVLTSKHEPGRILEVVEPGNEFDVHEDFTWVDCDQDEVDQDHTYTITDGVYNWIRVDYINDTEFATEGYKFARMIGYKDIGEQLDMIYKELMANGTLSATGPWATHITDVKNSIPKNDTQAVLDWYENNSPNEE